MENQIERQKNIYKTNTKTIYSKLEMDKENRDITGHIVSGITCLPLQEGRVED